MHYPPENLKEKEYHSRIIKVLSFIQENLSEEMNLETLSKIACYSPFHFQKIFLLYVGETPKQYIMRLRMERISHYIKLYPEMSINTAAFQCGFSSPSTFIRAFKKYYGMTPESFRKIPLNEISKIGTLNPNKGKFNDIQSSDLWTMNLNKEEIVDLTATMKIEVKTIQPMKLACIETHLGDKDAIPNAFKAINRWAEPRDLITTDTKFVGVLLDLPFFTEYAKCRFRACITIPEDYKLPKEIAEAKTDLGRYACFTLKGSAIGVFKSLIAFRHGWLDQSGYQIAEITGFELYSENPAKSPYETIERQVFIPVKPA